MGTDSVIFIRTDGNSKIATGHLVRCLCITQALEKEGKKVIFLLSDEESLSLLEELSSSLFPNTDFSYETNILPTSKFDHLEAELPFLTALLTKYKDPVLFIDSYYVTEFYFASLRPYTKLAYMDDLRSFDYDVDLVINYDVIPPSKQAEYDKAYSKASHRLLGAKYTPLRPQFQNQTYNINKKLQNLLITTGGSDPYEFCEKISISLLHLTNDLTIHIVIGKLFTQSTIDSLTKLSEENSRIQLYQNVSDMATLMKQNDFAISAGGTTLYELCAIGVPSVSIAMSDNQLIMTETFAETGAIPYAGDLRNNITNTIDNILDLLKQPSSFLIRNQLHLNMKSLVDGNGTNKITKALCNLY